MSNLTNMPGGGTAYYGHSTDNDADFRTAMNLLQGDGHINWTYSTAGGVLKYDWMDTGKWIAALDTTGSTGFAYSVYKSTNGDIFGVMRAQNNGYNAPVFDGAGADCVWAGSELGGISNTTDHLTIIKLKATDVLGTGDNTIYMSLRYRESTPFVCYPDTLPASTANSNLRSNSGLSGTGYRFTVLGPIISYQSPSVVTFTRMIYTTEGRVSPGAYTIAGYNFRIVSDDYTGACIALRNDATS